MGALGQKMSSKEVWGCDFAFSDWDLTVWTVKIDYLDLNPLTQKKGYLSIAITNSLPPRRPEYLKIYGLYLDVSGVIVVVEFFLEDIYLLLKAANDLIHLRFAESSFVF